MRRKRKGRERGQNIEQSAWHSDKEKLKEQIQYRVTQWQEEGEIRAKVRRTDRG